MSVRAWGSLERARLPSAPQERFESRVPLFETSSRPQQHAARGVQSHRIRAMSPRFTALKPQLNRIRAWAQEGSTDAWIAHQLDTTADAIRAFRQEHGIERGGPAPLAPITPDSVVEAMLAEEEAAAAARPAVAVGAPAPEFDTSPAPEPADDSAPARAPRRRTRKRPGEPVPDASADPPAAEAAPAAEETTAGAGAPAKRSGRATRSGSGRSGSATAVATDEPPAAPESSG